MNQVSINHFNVVTKDAPENAEAALMKLLSLSLSGLFLYGALSLFCLRLRGAAGTLAAPAVWLAAGMVPILWPTAAEWLNTVPTVVFCLLCGAALALYLAELRCFCRRCVEGGFSYAVR